MSNQDPSNPQKLSSMEQVENSSRRQMIKTLSLGLVTIPFIVNGSMTEVPVESLDPGEQIIPVDESDMEAMQKFIEACISANKESNPQQAVKEVMEKAVKDPNSMLKVVGEPKKAGLKVFHRSKELTIFAASWTPQMNLMPHNHHMWANIAIYTGREDNILWHRTKDGLKADKAECLFAGDVANLSTDVIHSVTNPLERFTGGIHIYGGDFFDTVRSQWDPETMEEEPSDGDVIRAIFQRANERMERLNK